MYLLFVYLCFLVFKCLVCLFYFQIWCSNYLFWPNWSSTKPGQLLRLQYQVIKIVCLSLHLLSILDKSFNTNAETERGYASKYGWNTPTYNKYSPQLFICSGNSSSPLLASVVVRKIDSEWSIQFFFPGFGSWSYKQRSLGSKQPTNGWNSRSYIQCCGIYWNNANVVATAE